MSKYRAKILWKNTSEHFTEGKYSRNHSWQFDGGSQIEASASTYVVPEPYSDPSALDPEEAFVASLSSCHMLWFLSLAAKKSYIVTHYEDQAEGYMQKNKERKLAITEVILRPVVKFDQNHKPDSQTFEKLHYQAHQQCFLAHSVKTDIIINSQFSA